MLAPRLMPEMIISGISSSNPVTARCTQSVGVPFTNRKPFAEVRTESGRSRVSELEAPLRSRSGATTVTLARSESASARTAMPGAKYPSSLLSRMRTFTPPPCPSRDQSPIAWKRGHTRRILPAEPTRPPRLLPDGDTGTIQKSVDCGILGGARRNLTTFPLAIDGVGPEFTRDNQSWHRNRYDIGIDRLLFQTKRKTMRKSFWKDALASLPPSVQVRYAASFEAAERFDAQLDLGIEAWGCAKR